MTPRRRWLLSTAFALGAPAALSAQWTNPALRDYYEAAAARIKSVRLTPSPVRIGTDDTVSVRIDFLDAQGNRILVTLPDGKTVPPKYYLMGAGFTPVYDDAFGDTPETVRIAGVRGGNAAKVMFPRPPFPREQGQKIHYDELPVPIIVGERGTEKITIVASAFDAYVGTALPLGLVVKKRGLPFPDAAPTAHWTSSDARIAQVTDAGTVAFLKPGRVTITAENGGATATRVFDARPLALSRIAVTPSATDVRTGDVVKLDVKAAFAGGGSGKPRFNFAVSSDRPINTRAGAVAYDDGTFVAEEPGLYTVLVEAGGVSGRTVIRARARDVEMNAKVVSQTGRVNAATTEIMVFEGIDKRDYALLGTIVRNGPGMALVYDVTDPANPVLTDSVVTDARAVNDIRVDNEKGARMAVITKEGSPDRKNGIVLVDLTNPAHPKRISEYTATTTGGVHDVWIYKDRVYLTNDGTGDMHIIDITDPKNPRESGRWSSGTPGHYLHDLIVENGIAYLAYWDDGMIILDVGGAGKGGTLDKPVFVSRFAYGPGGHTHHVFRYKQYVFIADEGPEFVSHPATGMRGYVHVVDVSDLEHPKEVAKYYPTEVGAHNVWVEDDKLYIAYYQGGLRVVDVSGELRGDLYQQGRQVAWVHTQGEVGRAYGATSAFAWSPQLHKGHVFVSDMLSGMWVVKLEPKATVTP